jgi:hypothetical protein
MASFAALWIALMAAPAAAQVDQQLAEKYFSEAAALCKRDGGRLWGRSLCGPMVFADAQSRTIATNQAPPGGDRPGFLGFANAPVEWGGTRWATYIWSFIPADDRVRRGEIMIHELFHRIQPELGLMTQTVGNPHLDTVEGRYWLQLEWRALARALRLSGRQRRAAVRDALLFRAARHGMFPDARESERVEEIREGLAQYTATVVVTPSTAGAADRAIARLAAAEKDETFVQMFAYASGAAYGILLDGASRHWRQRVQASSDLAQMLMVALDIKPAENPTLSAGQYGGRELRAAEERREEQRRNRILELRRRFVDGPVLVLPGAGSGTFDTRGATPIPGSGTVYFSRYRITGEWGSLDAQDGVLVSDDRSRRTVPAPVRIDGATIGSTITGDGWTVILAPGWIAQSGPRPGDYQVVRETRE